MLVIRAEQMQALAAAASQRFETRALAELARFDALGLAALGTPAAQLAWLRQRLAESRGWGIEGADDQLDLLYLALEFAPDPLDRHPHFAGADSVLHDASLPGSAKVALLYQMLPSLSGATR